MESQYITTEQLSEIVKAGQNGRFLKTYADELGVSYQFLSKVLKGLCGPGDQIAKSLGYEQISVFRKIPEGSAIPAIPAEEVVKAIGGTKLRFKKATIKKAVKLIRKRIVGPKKGQYRVVRAGKKKATKKPSGKPKKRATPRKGKK